MKNDKITVYMPPESASYIRRLAIASNQSVSEVVKQMLPKTLWVKAADANSDLTSEPQRIRQKA